MVRAYYDRCLRLNSVPIFSFRNDVWAVGEWMHFPITNLSWHAPGSGLLDQHKCTWLRLDNSAKQRRTWGFGECLCQALCQLYLMHLFKIECCKIQTPLTFRRGCTSHPWPPATCAGQWWWAAMQDSWSSVLSWTFSSRQRALTSGMLNKTHLDFLLDFINDIIPQRHTKTRFIVGCGCCLCCQPQ